MLHIKEYISILIKRQVYRFVDSVPLDYKWVRCRFFDLMYTHRSKQYTRSYQFYKTYLLGDFIWV